MKVVIIRVSKKNCRSVTRNFCRSLRIKSKQIRNNSTRFLLSLPRIILSFALLQSLLLNPPSNKSISILAASARTMMPMVCRSHSHERIISIKSKKREKKKRSERLNRRRPQRKLESNSMQNRNSCPKRNRLLRIEPALRRTSSCFRFRSRTNNESLDLRQPLIIRTLV